VDDVGDVLAQAWSEALELVGGLDSEGLRTPTDLPGWTVLDLAFHLMLDAQRALVALADPRPGPPDTDRVTYWAGQQPGVPGADEHAAYVRRAAGAYATPAGLLRHWCDSVGGALAAVRHADPTAHVATQGHVLAVPDFVHTLVVEAAVHRLDLAVGLPQAAPAPAEPLRCVREVLDGLLGHPEPVGWDDATYARKGTGRMPLDARERTVLGAEAGRFPLFG
jgi:uncharacterized protein (TIGR03083 family)